MYKNYFTLLILVIFLTSCSKDNPVTPIPKTFDTLGIIIGKITDLSNIAIPEVQVNIQLNGNYLYGNSDTSGRYTIKNVPAGSYMVHTYKDGYNNDSVNVTVTKGDTTHADFQLEQTYWYRLNSNNLQSADAYQNMYINPQEVIFASTNANDWIGSGLGGFIKTSNSGANWQSVISNGSETQIYNIADNNLFIFTAMGQDGLGNFIGENKLYRSVDNGASWQEQINLNLEQIDGYKLVGMNNGTLFLNMYGWNGSNIFDFYKSVNQGASWTSYSPVSGYHISGLNRTSSGTVYIANYSDSLFYSTNGNDWTKRQVSNNTIRNNIINAVSLPTGEMISYGGASNYAISYDDGQNWNTLATNLADYPLPNKFKFNSSNEILSIVNNETTNAYGVYKSTDKCQTWLELANGLPSGYRPVSLALFQDYGYLLLADGHLYKTSKKTNVIINDKMVSKTRTETHEKRR